VMERRLLKAIINPAMIVTWLAGLYLAWAGHWFSAGSSSAGVWALRS
jgi:protoporphyrinogen IX oxidase